MIRLISPVREDCGAHSQELMAYQARSSDIAFDSRLQTQVRRTSRPEIDDEARHAAAGETMREKLATRVSTAWSVLLCSRLFSRKCMPGHVCGGCVERRVELQPSTSNLPLPTTQIRTAKRGIELLDRVRSASTTSMTRYTRAPKRNPVNVPHPETPRLRPIIRNSPLAENECA